MVRMDSVIVHIERLEEDWCATMDDGTKFLGYVEEMRNSVATYEVELTSFVQHQQKVTDGLMEAMEYRKKNGAS